MTAQRLNTFTDASGRVTVAVFRNRSASEAQHHHNVGAAVPEDMVAVGGGAVATNVPIGALLTASYPNGDLSAWLASSKDHQQAQAHFLTVYAIGLSIAGMDRTEVLGALHINRDVSGRGQHPEATATLPGDFALLGGGFNVKWSGQGNLGTATFPSTDRSWTARSKDHGLVSPASIESWAIGLRRRLPIGHVISTIEQRRSSSAQHPASSADVSPGFALTGGGAEVHWRVHGGLLWQLQPTTTTGNQDFTVSSKDHGQPEAHTITAYSVGIRLV